MSEADTTKRSYQVRDDDRARFSTIDFRRHAERGEWRQAILKLQELLDTSPARAVVVEVPGSSPPRFQNVRQFATALFDALPPEGREAWEQLERRSAEELLGRGLRLRREEDLVAAMRRYPHRDIARRASEALAQLAVARGDFDLAAQTLSELLRLAEGNEAPSIVARIAFAQAQMGDTEGLAATVARAAHLQTATVSAPGVGNVSLRAVFDRLTRVAAGAATRFAGARQFGGDRHGLGISEPPPETSSLGWFADTGFIEGIENPGERNSAVNDPFFSPVRPLIAQGAVYVNNGRSVVAYETASGRRLWRRAGPQSDPQWRDNPAQNHTVAVADGVVYAPLATRADHPDMTREFAGKTIVYSLPHRALYAMDARTGDVLWSHEGKALVGRPDADEVESESVASPPLVVGDDVIVATWAYNGLYEVRLVAFDRRTGATRWRTSLARGQQELSLFCRPVKELLTTSLAEQGGRVYLATGLGIAAAVDRVTGEVAWLTEYDQTPIPTTYAWYETSDRGATWRPSPVAATPNAVLIAPTDSPDLVAYDPVSGTPLWQRDVRPRAGLQWTWFLGVANSRAYVLGSRLGAMDLSTGRDLWTSPSAGRLAAEGRASTQATGTGLLTPTSVFVPTMQGIAEMDAVTGEFKAVRPLPRRPGRGAGEVSQNLVSGDGALCVWSQSSLECYYDFNEFRDRLMRRLQQSPDDPYLRIEAGELFRAAGRWDDAISCFSRGLETVGTLAAAVKEPVAQNLRRGLHEVLVRRATLALAVGDNAAAAADLERAADVSVSDTDAVDVLFALATTRMRIGETDHAKRVLERIVTEFGGVETTSPVGDVRGEGEEPERRSTAGALALHRLALMAASAHKDAEAVDAWFRILTEHAGAILNSGQAAVFARDRLMDFASARGATAAVEVTKRSRALLDLAVAAENPAALAALARALPDTPAALAAGIASAKLYLARNAPRPAAAVLLPLLELSSSREIRSQVLTLLASCYRAMDETARERGVLRRMLTEVPETTIDVPGADAEPSTAGAYAKRELASPRFADERSHLPAPTLPMAPQWETIGASGGSGAMVQVIEMDGAVPRGAEGHVLLRQENRLSLVSLRDGSPKWRATSEVTSRTAFTGRDRFVMIGGDPRTSRVTRLEAVRVSDGEPLWSRALAGRYKASATSLGVAYVAVQDYNEMGNVVSRLLAISLDSGETVAQADLPRDLGETLTVEGDAIVVFEQIQDGTPRRRALTLDAVTLSLRGATEIDGYVSPYVVAVPGTNVVATGARGDRISAIDVSRGTAAWPEASAGGKAVKNILALPQALIVSDSADRIRRFDARTGEETWVRSLADIGELGYGGEAAQGDLVVATLISGANRGKSESGAFAVGLDAETGIIRWKATLPLDGDPRRVLPIPHILKDHVAYELNERSESGEFHSRVILLSRADGALVATLSHPALSKDRQSALWIEDSLVLQRPGTSDLAVIGPAGAPK